MHVYLVLPDQATVQQCSPLSSVLWSCLPVLILFHSPCFHRAPCSHLGSEETTEGAGERAAGYYHILPTKHTGIRLFLDGDHHEYCRTLSS